MNKKKYFFITVLLFLFPRVIGCLKVIDLTKKPIEQSQLTFSERRSKYEKDVEKVREELNKRSGCRILGNSPRAISFLYSVYKSQKVEDFTAALMEESFFIELYSKEHIENCSVFGIITMANVSFAGKKNFIQKLLNKDYDCAPEKKLKHDFKPTEKDKEFAFFAKYKEFAPSIIQEVVSRGHLLKDVNIIALQLPQEIRNYIEELLFWLTFDERESLL